MKKPTEVAPGFEYQPEMRGGHGINMAQLIGQLMRTDEVPEEIKGKKAAPLIPTAIEPIPAGKIEQVNYDNVAVDDAVKNNTVPNNSDIPGVGTKPLMRKGPLFGNIA